MNNKNDRAINFVRFFFLGLAIALLILLGVLMFSIYRSSTREITDSELVIVDDTEAITEAQTEQQTETEHLTEAQTEAITSAEAETDLSAAADTQTTEDAQDETSAASSVNAAAVSDEDTTAESSDVQSVDGSVVVISEDTDASEDTSSESTGVYSTLNAACNFRSEAGYEDDDGNDTTIGIYQAGTEVEVLEAAGGWTKVKIDGVVGYVGAQFVGDSDTDSE